MATRFQVAIVEDHIYARLHNREERIPSLKQLDRSNIVIHIDSFAKVAFPGLRVGWIVAPPTAIERLRLVKQTTDLHTEESLLCFSTKRWAKFRSSAKSWL